MDDLSKALTDSVYKAYEKKLRSDVMSQPRPRHVAIIMDGNRRFARDIGLTEGTGHEMGRNKLEEVLEWCLDLDIKILTVYAFSTDNLNRQSMEIAELMDLFARNFRALGDDERVHRNKLRVRILGQVEILPREVQEAIRYAEERTADYDSYFFNVAVAYGGREEIVQAVKSIASDVKRGILNVDDIDQETVSGHLFTSEIPDPDLILRTSGEERISNFLLWQLAYAELYFADVYWPGFRKTDFLRALRSYQLRKRRWGK